MVQLQLACSLAFLWVNFAITSLHWLGCNEPALLLGGFSCSKASMTVLSCENDGTSAVSDCREAISWLWRRFRGFDPVRSVFQGSKLQMGMHPLDCAYCPVHVLTETGNQHGLEIRYSTDTELFNFSGEGDPSLFCNKTPYVQ